MNKLRKLAACLVRPAYWKGLAHGVAAGVEHEKVLKDLALRTIIDVGANKGQFALVARRLFPEARLVCFEPLTYAANRFRNVFAGDRLAVLEEMALGAEPGNATLHISARDDSSSLLPITDLQVRVFPGTAEKATGRVAIGRLSDVISDEELSPPALLKLDVQGYELRVLEGAGTRLDCFAFVYVECSFQEFYEGQPLASDVEAFLSDRGFSIAGKYNPTFDSSGHAAQADFLFLRKS